MPRWLLVIAVSTEIAPAGFIIVLPSQRLLSLMQRGVVRGRGIMRSSRLEAGHAPLLDAPSDQALDRCEKRTLIGAHQ